MASYLKQCEIVFSGRVLHIPGVRDSSLISFNIFNVTPDVLGLHTISLLQYGFGRCHHLELVLLHVETVFDICPLCTPNDKSSLRRTHRKRMRTEYSGYWILMAGTDVIVQVDGELEGVSTYALVFRSYSQYHPLRDGQHLLDSE